MTTKWFTSDHHFDHKNIIDFTERPCDTVQEMNEMMISRWNDVVQPRDQVFVLGDFAMGNFKESIQYARRLNGDKFLVPGNHDRCWLGHAKGESWRNLYQEVGFKILPGTSWVTLADHVQSVQLCHFPFAGDSQETDRFSGNRPDDEGQTLLHGHVHTSWKTNGRQMNVGVDMWDFYPVHQDTVLDWMLEYRV